jgi:hypothetical protein
MIGNLNSWQGGRLERALTCDAQLICVLSLIFTASVFGDVVANSTTTDSISIPGAGGEVRPSSVPDRRPRAAPFRQPKSWLRKRCSANRTTGI